MKKLKLIVSAFAFDPREPECIEYSSGYSAWKLVEQMAGFCDVSVVTTQQYRNIILEALSEGLLAEVSIHFVNVPEGRGLFKRPFLEKYARAAPWVRRASDYFKKVQSESDFDAAHHLYLNPELLPGFPGDSIDLPFVWGPLSGDTHRLDRQRESGQVRRFWQDGLKRTLDWINRYQSLEKKYSRSARSVLIGNPHSPPPLSKLDKRKVHIFPGYGLESIADLNGITRRRNQGLFTIVCSGSFFRERELEWALKCFSIFCRKFPVSELWIAGGNPEHSRCERILRNWNLQDKASYHSFPDRSLVREKLRNGDVFLNLQKGDGEYAWIIESMGAGLPVVSLPASSGRIIDADWFIEVKAGTTERMIRDTALALENLAADKRLRNKMARSALKDAAGYTWRRLGKKLKKIYGEAFLQEEDIRFAEKGGKRFFY